MSDLQAFSLILLNIPCGNCGLFLKYYLFSKDKTIVSKSKGSNKYMISFMIGISMFFIRVKMVSNYLELERNVDA